MAQEILIEIDEHGDVRIEGKGFAGPECQQLTADIEAALGTVEKVVLKPEHKRASVRTRKVGA